MRYSGMLLHGEYAEHADDLHGGTPDGEIIADKAAANVLHESIDVPDNHCPFDDGPKNVFVAFLEEIRGTTHYSRGLRCD